MKVLNTITAWCDRLFRGSNNKAPNWSDIEYFHDTWKNRIKAMSVYIQENSKVMDLGSGKEWLRAFLPANVDYLAVDYLDRGTGNLVCDFNKQQFPDGTADTAFISGCLEYIVDYHWFIGKVAGSVTEVIVSYNTTELVSDLKEREGLAWKNHLTEKELVAAFQGRGMQLWKADRSIPKNPIFIFKKQRP